MLDSSGRTRNECSKVGLVYYTDGTVVPGVTHRCHVHEGVVMTLSSKIRKQTKKRRHLRSLDVRYKGRRRIGFTK